jgi:hypothetical protein
MIETNFTIIDWKISTKLLKGDNDKFVFDNLSKRIATRLANNVFPGGNSFLH